MWRALLSLTVAFLLPVAGAIVVPLAGWVPIAGNADQWRDAAGRCLIREDRYTRAFPEPGGQQATQALANRLRAALQDKGMTDVTTHPVQRQGGGWAVLAQYGYQENGAVYRVSQLYFAQGGQLRTLSGSALVSETSPCAPDMRAFIRLQVQ